MATRTLYDWQPTSLINNDELVHPKPSVTVHLLEHDPTRHQQACNKVKDEAWETAVHMLDTVLARAAARTEAVTALTPPPFDESFSLLAPLISFLLSSSLEKTPPSSVTVRSPVVYIQHSGYSVDATCRSVRTLVELGSASALFDRLQECLKAYIERVVQVLTLASDSIPVNGASDSGVSREVMTFLYLVHAWGHYRLTVFELQEVWVFLDRWHIHRTRAVRSIEGLAIAILKETLLQHPWLLQRAQMGYLECLRQDFMGANESRREISLFTNLSLSIQVYFLRLEPEIVAVATQFYTSVGDQMWEENTAAAVFFPRVKRYLVEGRERVQAGCVAAASLPRLEEVAQTSLLMRHGIGFLERDFAELVRENNYECLRLAWQLLATGKYVRIGKQYGAVFRQYMLHEGAAIMRQLTTRRVDGEEYGAVKAMIALMYRGECVIDEGFAADSALFSVQLRDALAEALQEHQTEFAEQLARYLDWTIREGDSGASTDNNDNDVSHVIPSSSAKANAKTDASINSLLPSQVGTQTVPPLSPRVSLADAASRDARLKYIGRIYSLFPSKEVFETFYWMDLARRLLHHHRAPCIEIEENFLQCLKETCGAETSRFEGMINDIKSSLALDERYQSWVAAGIAGGSESSPSRIQVDNEAEEEAKEKEKRRKLPKLHKRRKVRRVNEEEEEEEEEEEAGAEENEKRLDEESEVDLANVIAGVDVKLYILTDKHWPKQTPLEIQLPQPLLALTTGIENFYRHCFSDRQLLWQHQLSSAVVKCALGNVRRQLTGTLLQAAILLTLQELMGGKKSQVSHVTVGVLCKRLAMDMSLPDVMSSLLGLCHPKFSLVLRESAPAASLHGKTSEVPTPTAATAVSPLSVNDRLRFNEDFSVNSMRCRIPLFVPRQRGGDTATTSGTGARADGLDNGLERTADAVMADRSHVIEAAIVRFMKEKRRVSHEELFTTVPTLVRFSIAMPVIKKVVERLIERGFLERSGNTTYTYLL